MNMLQVDSADRGAQGLTVHGAAIALTTGQQQALQQQPGAGLVVGLRPECMHFGDSGVPGTLTLLEPTGPDTYAIVDTAIGSLVLRVGGHVAQRVGDAVHLTWDARDLHLFNAETEARVG